MRTLIIALISLLVFLTSPILAGNLLSNQVFEIQDNGFSAGTQSTYAITENMHVLLDADINETIAQIAINNINKNLTDTQLTYSFSEIDYDHAIEFYNQGGDKRFKPNTFLIHLGKGFTNNFFATLRVFKSTQTPTGFIHLKKSDWIQADDITQIEILEHELRHLLLWAHASDNPFVDNFDFFNQDNNEPLYRLYDRKNLRGYVIINIEKQPATVVGFVGKKRSDSVYTVDNSVKLKPGKYKAMVNGRYLCKKKKLVGCLNIKQATVFNFKEDIEFILR